MKIGEELLRRLCDGETIEPGEIVNLEFAVEIVSVLIVGFSQRIDACENLEDVDSDEAAYMLALMAVNGSVRRGLMPELAENLKKFVEEHQTDDPFLGEGISLN